MKIIAEKYSRYGEEDYDIGYVNWGFDGLDEQISMAEKLEKLFPENTEKILDVACGIARYHQTWLKSNYCVTGIDLSETFIKFAIEYNKDYKKAKYIIRNFNDLDMSNEFDVALWTDPIELTGKPVNNIYKALKIGGRFIYEMWNENFFEYQHRKLGQTWTCENDVYKLVKHQYNPATSTTEHEEIIFDINNDTMIHKIGLNAKNVNAHCCIQILEASGFKNIRFVDYEGKLFDTSDQNTKRFFMVGEK